MPTATLTPIQVAAVLQVKPDRARSLMKSGKIVSSNIGTSEVKPRLRCTPEALQAFLDSTRIHAPEKPARRRKRKPANVRKFF